MLALSPSRTQTGLTARDLLVGCVAENDPRFLGQALRLVQSIRWFGGEMARARVVVCVVGGLDYGLPLPDREPGSCAASSGSAPGRSSGSSTGRAPG